MADAIVLRILEQLLEEACAEGLFAAIFQEKQLRALFGKAEEILPNKNGEILGRSLIIDRRGVDIYGQERGTDISACCEMCHSWKEAEDHIHVNHQCDADTHNLFDATPTSVDNILKKRR